MKSGHKIKSSNFDSEWRRLFAVTYVLGSGIAIIVLLTYLINKLLAGILLVSCLIFYGMFVKLIFKGGLYLIDRKLVYKGLFKQKEISLDSVVAIKVIHEFEEVGTFSHKKLVPAFDKEGNPLLNKVKDEMNSKIWDSRHFGFEFWDCKIIQCVYDEELLQYLISLNPNIQRM